MTHQHTFDLVHVSAVSVVGRVRLSVQIEIDASTWAFDVTEGELSRVSTTDGVLHVIGPDPQAGDGWCSAALTIGPLDRVAAATLCDLSISGTLDHVEIVALNNGTISATNLKLKTANVDLEQSQVTLRVTETVTGAVGYGSRLFLGGGADASAIYTANAGRVIVTA